MAGATGVLGTRLYVGNTALVDIEAAADAVADFTAASAVNEVGLIESLGTFGKTFDLVTFQAIADGRTYKFKGGYNAGTLDLVVAAAPDDVGQALLLTYAEAADQNTYPFRISLVGIAAAFDNVWFGGKVFSYQRVAGSVNNVLKANVKIEINTPIFAD